MKYIALLRADNDILLHGDLCVTTPQELYAAVVDKSCTEIEIRKEFANTYFNYTELCEFVENCCTVAPNVKITVDDTVYNDNLNTIKRIHELQSVEEFIFLTESQPDKMLAAIRELTSSYLSAHKEMIETNSKLSTALTQVDELKQQLQLNQENYNALLDVKNNISAQLQTLVNRVNFNYEQTVNPDRMFLNTENAFKKVLYFKELSRVHYTDTLLYYLSEIIKTLYSMPLRVVVIEPFYAYGRVEQYKQLNLVPHWDMSYRDVYEGNILMAGFQPKLMQDIALNSNHIQYLLVLDRGGMNCVHMHSPNVETFYMASDMSDITFNIDKNHVISYEADTLHIPFIKGFNDLSLEERIQKYSSTKIIQTLIDSLEEEK